MFNRDSTKRSRLRMKPKDIPEKLLNEDKKEEPIQPDDIPDHQPKDINEDNDIIDRDKKIDDNNNDINGDDVFPDVWPLPEENTDNEEGSSNEEPPFKEPIIEENNKDVIEDKKNNTLSSKPLVVDPDTTYFFVFGLASAGKSVMLSGLIYYLSAFHTKGQIKSTGDRDTDNHKRGDAVLSKMRRKVKSGEFVDRSKQIDKNEFVFPSEIHLKYVPSMSENKYEMPFCLLEMAGEDLKEIKLKDDGKSGGEFDERINSYLMHPNCSIAFICVVDPDDSDESEQVISEFITYLEKIGRTTNPALIAVSKWDRFKEEYNNNVDKYFDDNIKLLDRITEDEDREFTKMGFSIGSVSEDDTSYDFKPSDSEKLFKWMYEIAIGIPFDQEINPSFLSKVLSSIKKMFSK